MNHIIFIYIDLFDTSYLSVSQCESKKEAVAKTCDMANYCGNS